MWVCLKIGYIPNYSHLIGIMIINHWVKGYTIFRHPHVRVGFIELPCSPPSDVNLGTTSHQQWQALRPPVFQQRAKATCSPPEDAHAQEIGRKRMEQLQSVLKGVRKILGCCTLDLGVRFTVQTSTSIKQNSWGFYPS